MRSGKVRILHVIQNLNYGGMERLLADLVLGMNPAVFENHVLVLQYLGRFAEGLESRATLHVSQPLGRWSMVWPGKLSRQVESIDPDVVHSHSGVWLKAARAARMAGVSRVIHTEHGRQCPDPLSARIVDGLAARYTDVAVAVSEALGEQLAASVVRKRAVIAVVPNGVDLNRFRPRPDSGRIRAELAVPADIPILGSIGRLEPIKGYDIMLEAFAELVKAWPSGRALPHLVLAGDGSARAALELRRVELGIAAYTHLLGWRDDVDDLLSCFSLFTMSSRSEGTSVSLLEAMSSGLCPVLTRVGGNSAVLGLDLAHRLVPAENPGALAMAWMDALSDCQGRARDGARARSRIGESFSLEKMVQQYERLYRGLHAP